MTKRISRRLRLQRIYATIYKRGTKGVTLKQIHAWHHISKSSSYFYLRVIIDRERAEKVGKYWVYKPPEAAPPPPRPPEGPVEIPIESEHERLLSEERSPRIEYIENYYASRVSRYRTLLSSATGKVSEISSLNSAEARHIIAHLRSKFAGTL